MAVFVNEEMWAIDGSPLSTWAFNIESIGGRQGIPVMAGDNFSVPFRAGEVWRSKMPQARHLSLGMWVRSSDSNGVTPKTATGRRAQFNENLRALRNMFYNRDRLLTLTKNVRYLNGIQAYTTLVECTSDLEPQMSGPNFGKMVVDLKMVDPYWTTGALTQTINATLSGVTINNPGDDFTHRMTIQMNFLSGGGGSSILKNMSYNPPLTLSVPTPGAGIPWTIDVENFFLSRAGDLTTNWQNSLNRSGPSAFWFEFKKGANTIVFDSRFGDGSFNSIQAVFTYYPLYL
jgi:hypothetical protein